MKQEQLDLLAKDVGEVTQMYVSGLYTVTEFVDFLAVTRAKFGADFEVFGLLDPNTGLRFPTKAETEMAKPFNYDEWKASKAPTRRPNLYFKL